MLSPLGSSLDKLTSSLSDLKARLDSRRNVPPSVFAENMKLREDTHHLASYIPQGSVDDLFAGTWYLVRVDEKHRRYYARTSLLNDGPLEAALESVHSTNSSEHFPSPAKKVPRIPTETEAIAVANGEH
ncbi:hypothetical protein GDO81_002767 [Engystomops pustulosus]|uniref:Hydroxymethylglutaryl-coenzyme A synthase C-terminal domain-containing protein n=1 Tax=Engystomops pustulosus TaxID=76066 RepID=A0AAV7DPB9_ENGPU|nr:hypothetical protein GDO81_002767 [Engystomops pustulosus]